MVAVEAETAQRRLEHLLLASSLVLAALAVYLPVVGFGFTGLDDPEYVTKNPHVLAGLSLRGIVWAFTTLEAANWHPLTWMSLMADSSIGGGAAAVYHTTNLLLHALNTVLLFLALDRLTGQARRSAIVAALFAVHPLHVESVAWIAERKDVLCGTFWILALLAYARYVSRPSLGRYLMLTLAFAAGLLAKPMIVTLPLVLLLLDFWPLGRFDGARGTLGVLVREKLPLAALAAASSTITVVAQSRGGAVGGLESYPLWARAGNAIVSYAAYLRDTVWPVGLAVLYPHPGAGIAAGPVVLSAAVLAALTVVSVRLGHTRPALIMGWLWYLGTLAPTIGIVQVGLQARADRYTYIPLVGIFVAVAWLVPEWIIAGAAGRSASGGRRPRWVLVAIATLSGIALFSLMGVARAQVGHWRDRRTLFERLTSAVPDYPAAHNTLGTILFNENALDEAMQQFRRAIELDPRHAGAHNNLGLAFERQGRNGDALKEFQEAVRIDRRYAKAHEHLGRLYLLLGRSAEAVPALRESVRLNPKAASAHAGLAAALVESGDAIGASAEAREALREMPKSAEAHRTLGAALLLQSDFGAAVEQFSQAVAIDPDQADAHANLAGALLAAGRPADAVEECRQALRLVPVHVGARTNLGLALLQQGKRDEAREELSEALRLDPGNARARRLLEQLDKIFP